jgi:SnoaL-like domain
MGGAKLNTAAVRKTVRRSILAIGSFIGILSPFGLVSAASQGDELRKLFEQFIAAQNAHDVDKLRQALLDAPDFLWITPQGEGIWSRDAAIERFRGFFRGAWKIEPDMAQFRILALGISTAQLFVPILLTAGSPNEPARPVRYLLNLTIVHPGDVWKIASILPVPAPAQ